MNALDAAVMLGVDPCLAKAYLCECEDVVESTQFVATLKGPTVHLAVDMKGLGGRKLLRECREVLRRWYLQEPVLYAPIKHGNTKAIRVAEALGFFQYATSETHVWLVQTKEKFHGH